MKMIISFILLTLFSVCAHAANLSDFVGKYTVGKCSGETSRAYISYSKKSEELTIRMFGDDGSEIISLALGEKRTPNPNFKYGNPIKETITIGMLSEDTVTKATTYVYGDDSHELAQVISLKKTEKGALLNSSGEEDVSCELVTAQ